MPRNFDELKTDDREFVISGQTFKWTYIHWTHLSDWLDADISEAAAMMSQGTGEAGVEVNGDERTLRKTMDDVSHDIARYLPEDQRDRWWEVIRDENNPVTILQLNEISGWLVEQQTRRPTEPANSGTPSKGSSSGRGKAAASSADA